MKVEASTIPWLPRAAWLSIAIPALAAYVLPLPQHASTAFGSCDYSSYCTSMQLGASAAFSLAQHGISQGEYAAVVSVLYALFGLVWFGLATVIMLRKPRDRGAWATAVFLLLFPLFIPVWWGLVPTSGQGDLGALYATLAFLGLAEFAAVFPNGRFVPGWTLWPTIAVVFVILTAALLPEHGQSNLWAIPVFVLPVGAVSLQVYRFRAGYTWIERQQTKWALTGVLLAFLGYMALALTAQDTLLASVGSLDTVGLYVLLIADLLIVPIFIGVAVLRSRLWDIDRVINRALVYGLLTAGLGAVYTLCVLVTEAFSRFVDGRPSTVAVAVSTLVIAALFGPLRRSIQAGIDRRFYRGKYDAQRMLASFSERLRDEVDLDQVTEDLEVVVDAAFHPQYQALWVRDPSPNVHHHLLVAEDREEQ